MNPRTAYILACPIYKHINENINEKYLSCGIWPSSCQIASSVIKQERSIEYISHNNTKFIDNLSIS